VKCVFCHAELPIRAEHCYQCGKKIVADFDALAQSVHEDAAHDRARRVESYLKWVLLALLMAIGVLYGVNDLFDKPLAYDAAVLPAMNVPAEVAADIPVLKKNYVDPRPEPPLPAPRITAYGYRCSPLREKLRAASHGDSASQGPKTPATAVADGLRFLAAHQNGEGCWPVTVDPLSWNQYWDMQGNEWGCVGVSGLALMALLGEGDTWVADDASRKKSLYADKIQRGLKFLLRSQEPATGKFRTYDPVKKTFAGNDPQNVHFMYNQGMATIALCEAAGISGDENLRAAAQKAIKFILDAQTPKGGWNYFGSPVGDNDTSLSAWQVQALCAAREIGLSVPRDKLGNALELYKQATQSEQSQTYVRYSLEKEDKADRGRVSLCGVALMARQLLGEERASPALRRLAEEALKNNRPVSKKEWGLGWAPNRPKNDDTDRARLDPYSLYFATYGMYFLGGREWDEWNEQMKKALLELQSDAGGWRTNDVYSKMAGTNYSTALCVLTLQVYYRLQ